MKGLDDPEWGPCRGQTELSTIRAGMGPISGQKGPIWGTNRVVHYKAGNRAKISRHSGQTELSTMKA